jgi:hypothetical protein
MHNSGKKPIDKKLEEARSKLFTEDTFKELISPTMLPKYFDNTYICVLVSLILNYFIKGKLC